MAVSYVSDSLITMLPSSSSCKFPIRTTRREKEGGHPYLYGLAIVQVWTILETLADDIVLKRLAEGRYKMDSEFFVAIKLPLREILGATPERQAEAVLNELKQVTRARLQQGVGRFEALLSAVSLGGAIDEDVRKAIFECSQIRNLVVHQNAKVDSKFMAACPWFLAKKGESLPLSRNHFLLYYNAAYWYVLAIQLRLDSLDGEISHPRLIEIHNSFFVTSRPFKHHGLAANKAR